MRSKLLDVAGENTVRENYPRLFTALCDVNTSGNLKSNHASAQDNNIYMSTQEMYVQKTSAGCIQKINSKRNIPFVAMTASLRNRKTGQIVDTFNEYWENTVYEEVRLLSEKKLAQRADLDDLILDSTYTYSLDGVHLQEQTGTFSVNQFYDGEPIITELVVDNPRAQDGNVTKILYDRYGTADYQYLGVVSEDRKSAKVMIPFSGKITVDKKFEILGIFTSAEKPKMAIIFQNGYPLVNEISDIDFQKNFTIQNDGTELVWDFNPDWHQTMDLEPFSAQTIVDFSCVFTLSVRKRDIPDPERLLHPIISVNSVHDIEKREGGALEIEPIQILWGCLDKGTQIRMEDGSRKTIENIRIGEKVTAYGKNGQTVIDIISGRETSMVHLETENGCILSLTVSHPVLTDRGLVRADKLNAADIIYTEDGMSQVHFLYQEEKNTSVYNLVLEQPSLMFCNGIISGDFMTQNNMRNDDKGHMKSITPLQKEMRCLMEELKYS